MSDPLALLVSFVLLAFVGGLMVWDRRAWKREKRAQAQEEKSRDA